MLIGEKFKHKERGWIVEVLSETKTHVYIKHRNALNIRQNVSLDYFKKYYISL